MFRKIKKTDNQIKIAVRKSSIWASSLSDWENKTEFNLKISIKEEKLKILARDREENTSDKEPPDRIEIYAELILNTFLKR